MSKYALRYTTLFKKQRKLLIKRGYNIKLLDDIIIMLANGENLPEKHRDHALTGCRKGQHDCHIRPDWPLIYERNDDVLTLLLCETGTHADLFDE
ncbi:MAG: type II toxin-antitoxin system YafQ family toxin [Desulfovibrio sp.]|jgi:mRNA interferase YafQ|nr:type II toxin-antitoxin system YafQ family toxin [Desulfovibrio sp.]